MVTLRDLCRLFLEPDFQRIVVYEVTDDGVSRDLIHGTARAVGRSKYGECYVQSIVQSIDPTFDGDPVLAVFIMTD